MRLTKYHLLGAVVTLTVMFGFHRVGHAEEFHGDYRIGTLYKSNHFMTTSQQNERHHGVILEARIGRGWLGFMNYDNSEKDADNGGNSNTLYWNQTFKGGDAGWIDIGWQAGAVTGYEDLSPAPYIAINFTIHLFGYFKPRLALVPGVLGHQYLLEF